MTQDIVKGYDNELVLRIKYTDGNIFDLKHDDPNREHKLLGIRIYLFSKFREVVMRFGVNIVDDEWNTVASHVTIKNEDGDDGIVSIKVIDEHTYAFHDGPYYLRATLMFEDVEYPGNQDMAIPEELLHCGYVIGENEESTSTEFNDDGIAIAVTSPSSSASGLPATNVYTSPLTTKGDIFTYINKDARLPVGADNYVLTASSAEETGLKWALPVLPTGLERISEGGNSGLRWIGADPLNYGDNGEGAVDFSLSSTASTTRGATGDRSFATGYRTTASGTTSTAIGYQCTASDTGAFSGGSNSSATADQAFSFGSESNATGIQSVAMGDETTASGTFSAAFNSSNTSSGLASMSFGRFNTAFGISSTAFGFYNFAYGNYSFVGGHGFDASNYTKSTGVGSFAFQEVEDGEGIKEAIGINSVILGGKNNDTQASAYNSAVIVSIGISASLPNTVYLPQLKLEPRTLPTGLGTSDAGLVICDSGDSNKIKSWDGTSWNQLSA